MAAWPAVGGDLGDFFLPQIPGTRVGRLVILLPVLAWAARRAPGRCFGGENNRQLPQHRTGRDLCTVPEAREATLPHCMASPNPLGPRTYPLLAPPSPLTAAFSRGHAWPVLCILPPGPDQPPEQQLSEPAVHGSGVSVGEGVGWEGR